jgi:hypothetical protein
MAILIVLGLVFLLMASIGDVTGASALRIVLLILGWVLWRERERARTEWNKNERLRNHHALLDNSAP